MKKTKVFSKILIYLILGILGFCVLLPVLWMFISSFKDVKEIYARKLVWFPSEFRIDNFTKVLEDTFLLPSFFNSLKVVLPPVFVGVLTSAMAAFAFSKLRFPGKNAVFALMFATMAVPGVVTMIPAYLLFNAYGWLDTLLPLIIPGMCGNVMTMFFLRQYFAGLPSELKEAAVIDGMSYGGIFFKIYLPLAKPAIIIQLVLSFNGAYNDYMGPLLYINEESQQTIQIVLNSFIAEYSANWQFMLAGSVLALIPSLLLFIFGQDYLVEGIAFTGLKG